MPFDSKPQDDGLLVELQKLDAVIALLSDPARWCKGVEMECSIGRDGELHFAYCMVGALRKYCRDDDDIRHYYLDNTKPFEVVRMAVSQELGTMSIIDFNDSSKTRHSDVMNVLKRARELLINDHNAR